MSKNFFQDMIKIKNDNREKLNQQVGTPVVTPPITPAVASSGASSLAPELAPPVTSPSLKSFNENKFASIYDVAEKGNGMSGSRSKHLLWFIAGLCILFLLFSLSFLFSGAKITIHPKVKDVSLNQNFSAVKDSSDEETLPFDLVIISGEENTTLEAAGEKDALEKAEGTIVMYNTFSTSSQTLLIDTKLEGSNGKIYKTLTRTVVPGMAKDGKPGSVEVKIYASEAGAEYNSGPIDFKIVNFKGGPKYSKFYARSNGFITGGLKGKMPIIPDAQKLAVEDGLKTTLETKLFKKALDQIPPGFILFKDASYLRIEEDTIDLSVAKDNLVPIKLKGSLYGLLFDESKLTKKITENAIDTYDGSSVMIPNIKNLTFSLSNKDNILFADIKNVDFNLSGVTKIIWNVDTNKLTTDFLGKSKKDFNQILSTYPNIDSADLVISPFWKMSLPSDPKKIKIIVDYPK